MMPLAPWGWDGEVAEVIKDPGFCIPGQGHSSSLSPARSFPTGTDQLHLPGCVGSHVRVSPPGQPQSPPWQSEALRHVAGRKWVKHPLISFCANRASPGKSQPVLSKGAETRD